MGITPGISAIKPVQDAVYAALNVSALNAYVGGRIYTKVTQGSAFPYVRVTGCSEARDDRCGSQGRIVTVPVHVFSQAQGDAEATTILGVIVSLLHYATLTLASGYAFVSSQYDTATVQEEFTGSTIETRHVIATFHIRVNQA